MILFEGETLDDVYPQLCSKILEDGHENSPRGLKTFDLGTISTTIYNPWFRILTNKRRRINPYFLFAEFLWIAARQDRVDMLGFYNKKMWDFSDDGRKLHGAYGPRLMWQLPNIVSKIKADRNTRQAVATIFKPYDQQVQTKDFPCNIMLHFIPRDGRLDLNVYVRSQDILLGLPYDFYHWSLIQEMVAAEVTMDIGKIEWICGSLHGYERDYRIIEEISRSTSDDVIKIEEPLVTKLVESQHEIIGMEFRNKKADVTESFFTSAVEEIQKMNQDQVIKFQLSTLLYYRTRKKENFGIPKEERLKATGPYSNLITFLGWD